MNWFEAEDVVLRLEMEARILHARGACIPAYFMPAIHPVWTIPAVCFQGDVYGYLLYTGEKQAGDCVSVLRDEFKRALTLTAKPVSG